ncbi:MAG: translation initiation factor 2 [Micromonosporaceae bacterium]|nr:translation initiation factor 2 [Micromonosporaceae bacterium]
MTSNAEPPADDEFWRRPVGGPEAVPGPAQAAPPGQAPPPYSGPPRSQQPPPGWKPPLVVRPAGPRPMPAVDHEHLDNLERSAATITNGVGLVAGAIMLILLVVLCGRWLF